MTERAAGPNLYRLIPGQIWRFLKTQSASFWFLCIYMFFEYVRPQQLFPVIDVLPWAQMTLIGALVSHFVFEGGGLTTRSPANLMLAVFALLVLASTVAAYMPGEALANYDAFFGWVLVYILITNIVTSERRFVVFTLAFLLYNVQMSYGAMKQWAGFGFGFRSWGVTGGAGWFNNSGDFGIAMCIFVPVSLHFALALRNQVARWKFLLLLGFPVSALLGIIASSSRGALLGMAAVGFWFLVSNKRYRARALVATVVLAGMVYLILPAEQKERFANAGTDETSRLRLTYWRHGMQITNEHPLLGVGYYNWLPYYRRNYNPNGQQPHNIFVQVGAELGYPGLLVFLGLAATTLVINRRTRKLTAGKPSMRLMHMMSHGFDGGLIGYLAAGFFVSVFWYPLFWVNLAMAVALHEVARREANARVVVSAPGRGTAAVQRRALRS